MTHPIVAGSLWLSRVSINATKTREKRRRRRIDDFVGRRQIGFVVSAGATPHDAITTRFSSSSSSSLLYADRCDVVGRTLMMLLLCLLVDGVQDSIDGAAHTHTHTHSPVGLPSSRLRRAVTRRMSRYRDTRPAINAPSRSGDGPGTLQVPPS